MIFASKNGDDILDSVKFVALDNGDILIKDKDAPLSDSETLIDSHNDKLSLSTGALADNSEFILDDGDLFIKSLLDNTNAYDAVNVTADENGDLLISARSQKEEEAIPLSELIAFSENENGDIIASLKTGDRLIDKVTLAKDEDGLYSFVPLTSDNEKLADDFMIEENGIRYFVDE